MWYKICQHSKIDNLVGNLVIESFEQKIWKQIDYKKPSSTKQINRVQNILIEICK